MQTQTDGGQEVNSARTLATAMIFLTCISACAPAPESITRAAPDFQVGPRLKDVDLMLEENPPEPSTSWSGEVSAAGALRFSESLLSIQGLLAEQEKSTFVQSLLHDLPQERSKLVESDYAALLIERSETMAKSSLDEILPKLQEAPQRIKDLLEKLNPPVKPGEAVDLSGGVRRYFAYLRELQKQIPSAGLSAPVAEGLLSEVEKLLSGESVALQAVRTFTNAKTLSTALQTVTSTASRLGLTMGANDAAKIKGARVVAQKLDSFQDAQGALSLLIELWLYLDAKDRNTIFKQANADLYDYFKDLSASDLRCLQNTSCFSLPKWLARHLVIYPKLRAYGLERMRTEINSKGIANVRSAVQKVLSTELRRMPDVMASKVVTAIRQKIAVLSKLKSDFKTEFRKRLAQWAENALEKSGPSVHHSRLMRARLKVGSSGRIEMQWLAKSELNPESSGAMSALSPLLWKESTASATESRGLMLAEVSRLARMFRRSEMAAAAEKPLALSARAVAESVRGAAQLAVSFRDWESNSVDRLLGEFRARDLFPEYDLPELNQPLFPKTALFALSFKELSDNLNSVTNEQTQVFLVDENNKVIPANEVSAEAESPAVMVGIADKTSAGLAPVVRSEDVSRYLLAMCDVLEATRSVEASNAEELKKPDANGKTPISEIVAGRESIRMLILGLANYLSHRFRAGGDLIQQQIDLATQLPLQPGFAVSDQALAIRALLAASRALGTDVYRWEAIDLLIAMNQHLYREELGFYALAGEKNVSPLVVVETLRALDEIAPYLRPGSRRQIELLAAPWKAAYRI